MAPEHCMLAEGGGRFYYQLVIRIFKGRMFPPTHDEGGRQIALEARFNGENLATDPVALCAEPLFNTELVWEFGAAKHREIKEREGSTLRLQCVLAGDEMPQTGARQIGFVMLDLRSHACGAMAPTIGTASGRKGSVGATAKSESRWYQLRGARQPLPEVKIFVKINCKPIVSLVSGPPALEDLELADHRGRGLKSPRSPHGKRRADGEQLAGWEASMGGKHGTVVLPPRRLPAGVRRELGTWGRYSLAIKCKSVTQEQVGVRSTVPLDEGWSLLLGLAGRMYAMHAPKNLASALAPGVGAPEIEAVHEVFVAEASSLVDFLERSDGRGGGIAIWLFIDGKQFACGTAGLGQLAGAVGHKWKEGQIGTMAASTVLLNTWVPSRMDDRGGSGPGAHVDADENMASGVAVELDIDLLGLGSGPEPPVPVPEFEQQVPCNMTITIISLSFDGGLPFGVGSVKVECRRGSVRRLGEADSIPLHTSQAVRLDAEEGRFLGVGEMFTMAGEWGDLRSVVLEFDLSQAAEEMSSGEERLLGAGMVDVGTAICCEPGKDDLPGVAGAMRMRTVALVDQGGRAIGRLSVMVACNLALEFPKGDPDADDRGLPQAGQRAMVHEAQRAALVCEAAPEGMVDISREISLSIDLQAVRALTNRSDCIYLRYSLPALGYMPPVLTAPPVETTRHGAQSFQNNSYNQYEVTLSYRNLAAALATPIQLEVWSKEKYAKDRLIALGDLHLWLPFAVLRGGDEEQAPAQRNWPTEQREWAGVVTAYEVQEASARQAEKVGVGNVDLLTTKRKLFSVSVRLIFDDKGPAAGDASSEQGSVTANVNAAASAQAVLPAARTRTEPSDGEGGSESGVAGRPAPERNAGRAVVEREHVPTREKESDSGGWEISDDDGARGGGRGGGSVRRGGSNGGGESVGGGGGGGGGGGDGGVCGDSINRGGASESFTSTHLEELRAREAAMLRALEQEFRRQEEQRERTMARKLAEVTALESALKHSLHELERRERRLEIAEEEAQARRRSENAQIEQKRAELQEVRKRMREESAHDVSMADARRNEALQQLKEEKAKLKESEERNARLDAELHKLRASQRNTSEPTLMVEVASLKAKNDELVDRLHRSEEQHLICKEQLAKALTRLSKIRDEEHQREVDSMKILLHARSESDEIRHERAQLDELKQHIQALKERGSGGAGGSGARAHRAGSGSSDGRQNSLLGSALSQSRPGSRAFESIPEDADGDGDGEADATAEGVAAMAHSAHVPFASSTALLQRSPHKDKLRAAGFAVPGEARPEGADGGGGGERDGGFGGDVPQQRRPTTEKEKQMLAQLTEEHMRLRDERDALLRTGIYSTEDDVILEIQRHMWQVNKEISEVGLPWRDHWQQN